MPVLPKRKESYSGRVTSGLVAGYQRWEIARKAFTHLSKSKYDILRLLRSLENVFLDTLLNKYLGAEMRSFMHDISMTWRQTHESRA